MHPTRRHVLAAPALAAVVPMTAADTIDSSSAEYDACHFDVHHLAHHWERVAPADAAVLLGDVRLRAGVAATDSPEWRELRTDALLMEAQAWADNGTADKATQCAANARGLAGAADDLPRRAHAELILAEIGDHLGPNRNTPLDLIVAPAAVAERALERGQHSYAGPLAAAILAKIMARRGDAPDAVLEVLRTAEKLPGIPVTSRAGFALGAIHPAYLAAFGGAALALGGATSEARARLDDAEAAFDANMTPGIASAVQLYRARAQMRDGDVDGAAGYAAAALATVADRGRPPAWLRTGLAELASDAADLGATWEVHAP